MGRYCKAKYITVLTEDTITKSSPKVNVHKVHIFWEGHKILRNLPLIFDRVYCSQKLGEDFAKFLWPSQNIWTLTKCLNSFWTDQTSIFAFKFEIQENCNHWSFTNFPSYPTLLIKQTYNIMIMRHVNENWKWSSRNFMRKQKRLKLLIQVLLSSLLRDGGQR